MTQEWVVGVIVAIAALYVVRRWLPASLRLRLGRVHPAMEKAAGCGGGCGSCGGCGPVGASAGVSKTVAAPAPRKPSGTADRARTVTVRKQGGSRL